MILIRILALPFIAAGYLGWIIGGGIARLIDPPSPAKNRRNPPQIHETVL